MGAEVVEKAGDKTRIMNQEELLQHLNVTYQTLWRYKKLGMPCIPMGGKQTFYDVDKVEAFLDEHGITGRVGRPGKELSPDAEQKKLELLQVKLRKELVLAERHEHALKRLKGEVVSTSSVQEAHLKRVQVVKAGLMSLPGKVAARCAHRSAHEVQAELELEVHALLTEFARPPEVVHSTSLTGSLAMNPAEVK